MHTTTAVGGAPQGGQLAAQAPRKKKVRELSKVHSRGARHGGDPANVNLKDACQEESSHTAGALGRITVEVREAQAAELTGRELAVAVDVQLAELVMDGHRLLQQSTVPLISDIN